MGIPKYYKWLTDRYPDTIEEIHSTNMPKFDNLYLDMNGIIHPMARKGAKWAKTQGEVYEKIFISVFSYIEFTGFG